MEAIITNNTSLISFLGQGNSFTFTLPGYASGSSELHVYPAIDDEDYLVFLVIPSEYDDHAYDSDFNDYVSVCKATWNASSANGTVSGSGTMRITAIDATKRMGDWDSDYTTWVPLQTATTDGMFMAFSVPTASFEVSETAVHLGLIDDPTLDKADMVVINRTSAATYYDNYAQSVPPFTPSANFYLLSL